ncbi:MAG: dihydrodipicolinate synthase family protein [Candidatus Baltobacteraceae bacterium]
MIAGIWAAVLTPVDEELAPDAPRAIAYYRDVLAAGCDGINLLGTTGEAMSLSADRRLAFMEAVASSDLPIDRVMVGTGAASLGDAARLTHCAFECGFAAALVMPPFFYRDASDDGIVAFFDALLSRVAAQPKHILLYNFPKMSGVAFAPDLVDRLIEAFPGVIAGMKDSSNDARLQSEVLTRHPGLAVLPGSEADLREAAARGAVGCISGSVALWPRLAGKVFAGRDRHEADLLRRRRVALDIAPLIPAMRYLTACLREEPAWERPIPPLGPLSAKQRSAIDSAIEPFGLGV